jgi:hypothetical protein
MELNDILILGFKEFENWEFKETGTKNYILKTKNKTFRAIYTTCNGLPYFQIGIVINENGIVDRWRDICSNESLNKLIL